MGAHGATSCRMRARADALQRRRACHGRIRHRARRDSRRGRAAASVAVFADETRPFLQGARLTAWELVRDGIDTTVITESMAGPLMRAGEIDLVVVGADRIAANGDTANKIGTYTVAVLAREHKIPFYVAAPLSTIDLATPTATTFRSRSARARGDALRDVAPDAGRRADQESCIRRDAASLHHRHHYREGIFEPPCFESLRKRRDRGRRLNLLASKPRATRPPRLSSRRPAILSAPGRSRSNIVASQTAIHREWGGVVPELASRQHVRDICGVVEAALGRGGRIDGRSAPWR